MIKSRDFNAGYHMFNTNDKKYFSCRSLWAFLVSASLTLLLPSLAPDSLVAQESRTKPSKIKKENTGVSVKSKESAPQSKDKMKKKDKDEGDTEEKKAKNILNTLEYGINQERRDAINKILTFKDKSIKRELAGRLVELLDNETDPEVAVKTITVLGELEESRAVPGIIKRLDDVSEEVRTAAVYSLKNLKAVSAKETLIKKLEKQDLGKNSNYTEALINTLGVFKARELIAFSEKAVKSDKTTTSLRENLVLFLGRLESNETKDFLIGLYKDEDEEITIRSYAVNSLAKLKVQEAAKEIKGVLETIEAYNFEKRKKYYNLYIYSVAALANLGDKDAVTKLMNSLRSDNTMVRLKALILLKDLKSERTIDILKYKMKHDPSPKVRKTARGILKEFGVEVGEEEKIDESAEDTSKD